MRLLEYKRFIFLKNDTRNVKLPFHAKYKVVATFHKSDSSF